MVRAALDATPSARAVGEIGLDYHYDFSPRDVQQCLPRAAAPGSRALPARRDPHPRGRGRDDRDHSRRGGGALRGVLHCFTARRRSLAPPSIWDSRPLAGIVTFPKAADLRETAKLVPLDRLLTETDSPFLRPCRTWVAQRTGAGGHGGGDAGRRSRYSRRDLAARTTDNYRALFAP